MTTVPVPYDAITFCAYLVMRVAKNNLPLKGEQQWPLHVEELQFL